MFSISAFSVDRARKNKAAIICKDCHREACEMSRIRKRVWQRKNEHYEMPGGDGITSAKRLRAFYERAHLANQYRRVARGGATH